MELVTGAVGASRSGRGRGLRDLSWQRRFVAGLAEDMGSQADREPIAANSVCQAGCCWWGGN